MAAVSVFVDDAIRGTLPMVCAKTGEPADYLIRSTRPVGGGLPSFAWLLFFFGPPGWAVMVVLILLASGREDLTVRIPRTRASFERERRLSRLMWGAVGAGLSCLGLAFLFRDLQPWLWLFLAGSFLVSAVVLHARVYFDAIDVSLDASRRWVTLTRVHPAFVRAVDLQESGTHRR